MRLLRFAPDVITGVNSQNAIRIAPPAPGVQITGLNPDLPTSRAYEYNFTIEHELFKDTVVRAGFIGTAGRNLEMMELFNRNTGKQLRLVYHHRSGAAYWQIRGHRSPCLRPDHVRRHPHLQQVRVFELHRPSARSRAAL
jgi:hypothetical protein